MKRTQNGSTTTTRRRGGSLGASGLAADVYGDPAYDPSENVKTLVEALGEKWQVLREADQKYSDDIRTLKRQCETETTDLREKLADAHTKRIDAQNLAEQRRVDAVLAEQKSAAALANEKQTAQATQLAAQVQATQSALATQTKDLREAMEMRLKTIEQNQYSTGGRESGKDEATALARQVAESLASTTRQQAESARMQTRFMITTGIGLALFIAAQMLTK